MILLLKVIGGVVVGILGDYWLVEMSGCHGSMLRHPQPPRLLMHSLFSSYLVTNLMGADLNNIVKFQKLSDEHVQFLIYQLLRGLKVNYCIITHLLRAILNAQCIQKVLSHFLFNPLQYIFIYINHHEPNMLI